VEVTLGVAKLFLDDTATSIAFLLIIGHSLRYLKKTSITRWLLIIADIKAERGWS
jgi:hypothetical protein